ncbi:unnamed protein product [Phaeothamnion confervicola]
MPWASSSPAAELHAASGEVPNPLLWLPWIAAVLICSWRVNRWFGHPTFHAPRAAALPSKAYGGCTEMPPRQQQQLPTQEQKPQWRRWCGVRQAAPLSGSKAKAVAETATANAALAEPLERTAVMTNAADAAAAAATAAAESSLGELPEPLLAAVTSYLKARDLVQLAPVSRSMQVSATSEEPWKALFHWAFGEPRCLTGPCAAAPADNGDDFVGVGVPSFGMGDARRSCCRWNGSWMLAFFEELRRRPMELMRRGGKIDLRGLALLPPAIGPHDGDGPETAAAAAAAAAASAAAAATAAENEGATMAAAADGDDWRLLVVIHGSLYDLTYFAARHPGGEGILSEYDRRDCTTEFERYLHSETARAMMRAYIAWDAEAVVGGRGGLSWRRRRSSSVESTS